MKKILLFIICAISSFAKAQDIPMTVVVDCFPENVSIACQTNLANSIKQALMQNGIYTGIDYATFAVRAKVGLLDKRITTGLQPMVTVIADLTLIVENTSTKSGFSSASVRLSGTGTTEQKAYIGAFSSLRRNNNEIKGLINDAKQKIVSYYNSNAPRLIQEARQKSAMHEHEAALAILASIPSCCTHYDEVVAEIKAEWQNYIDYEGERLLAAAAAIWNATQNRDGAASAAVLMSQIYSDAQCYSKVDALAASIRERIGDEWTFHKLSYLMELDLESQRIEAARAIGIAYGNQNTTIIL